MSKSKLQIQEEVSPNLIPMIDIMFLLLLFFMLGADMGQRELEEVMLPTAMAVKEEKEMIGEESNKLVVNVYHLYDVQCEPYKQGQVCRDKTHWRIGIKGRDYTDLQKLEATLKREADPFRAAPMAKLSTGAPVPFSERPVMVRADASAPFGHVQEVMNTCAKVGIYKIECGAARPPDADKIIAGQAAR
jgi:biopolymer transport protein ExbD